MEKVKGSVHVWIHAGETWEREFNNLDDAEEYIRVIREMLASTNRR